MSQSPKRKRGEGGVYWDQKRQRYIAAATVGYDARGKRVVRKASSKTESGALRELRKRVKAYESGLVAGFEHYRVKQAVEDWLDHGQGDRAKSTLGRNRSICEVHIIPKLGGRKLRELTPGDVDTWLVGLTDDLATSSIRRAKSLLSRIIRRAMKRGLVDRNVVDLCVTPRGRAGRPSKSLTLDQARDVLVKTRADQFYPYIAMSLLTGARTEEVRELRWEHVHLDAPAHVEVWRSVRGDGDTKTKTSRRTLALPALVVAELKKHRKKQSVEQLAASTWEDADLVFPTMVGAKMTAEEAREGLRRALALVPGLEPSEWTPREFRHSFVSLLSVSGVALEEISRLVGHKGTETTELVYRHELRPVIQTGATAMDDIFRTISPEAAGDA